ncbi:MAG: hypothetical protein MJZ13_08485 [Bacteroidales bacterium]|nr:hypothetical protein [Bacteroidales bacterium]
MEVVAMEVADPVKAKRIIESLRTRLTPHAKEMQDALRDARQGGARSAYEYIRDLNAREPLDKKLHDSYGQLIYYYLREGLRTMGGETAQEVLNEYIKLENERPSSIHSSIANMASHVCAEYPEVKLLPFIKAWGINNLTQEDLKPVQLTDRTIAPLSQRLIDRCLSLGYSIDEISEVFLQNPNITNDLIIDRICRRGYSSLYEASKRDPQSVAILGLKYVEQIKGLNIQNQYHSKALATIVYSLSNEQIGSFAELMEKWGIQNLREDDWQKPNNRNQRNAKEIPSLAQRCLQTYYDSIRINGTEPSDVFMAWIDNAIQHDKNNDFNHRTKARILSQKGKKDEALSIYRRLLAMNSRSYLWLELAQITDDAKLKTAAVCKALTSEAREERTTDAHLAMARIMLDNGMIPEAAHELLAYYNIATQFQQRIKPDYDTLQKQIPSGTTPTTSNKSFYAENIATANEFILDDAVTAKMKAVEVTSKVGRNGAPFTSVTLLSSDGLRILSNIDKFNVFNPKDVLDKCYLVSYIQTEDHCKVISASPLNDDIDLTGMITIGYVDGEDKIKKTFHIYDKGSIHYVADAPSINIHIGDFVEFYPIIPKDSNYNKAIIIRHIEYRNGVNHFGTHKAVVGRVDYNKRQFNCVCEGGYTGIVGYDNGSAPQPGETLSVAYISKTDKMGQQQIKYISIDPSDEECDELKKTVTGPIHLLRNEKNFEYGFVNFEDRGYYVSGYLLKGKEIAEGDVVTASVVFNGDNWFAFNLEKN